VENVVHAMGVPPQDLIAYVGPGIGARRYEVGEDVHKAFVERNPAAATSFVPRRNGTYLVDLYGLARQRLAAAGVAEVHGGEFCTASEERFFSFRRDRATGRMASLIWLEDG
jgi:copper oxidase (laccase) domain-containing protein